MWTMHRALAALASRFGIDQLAADAAGFAEIVIEDALPVFLRVVDEHELELSARLPELDGQLTEAVLAALLRWNSRLPGLRFAVEPGRDSVVLGQRRDIRGCDEAMLQAWATDFVCAVAAWRQDGARDLLEGAVRHADPRPELLSPFLRL